MVDLSIFIKSPMGICEPFTLHQTHALQPLPEGAFLISVDSKNRDTVSDSRNCLLELFLEGTLPRRDSPVSEMQ